MIYMRGHEGRGIGLINKLRAYSLQERGLDTVDANLALGLPADARDYAAAAGILADLGVEKVRLLTNNTDKVTQLRELGLEIVEQVPLLVGRRTEQPPVPLDEARPDGPPDRRVGSDRCARADARRSRSMSGKGAPIVGGTDGTGLDVVIVAGTWHDVITDGLIAGAQRTLDAAGATWQLVRVPGSFELAVAAQAAFAAGADAVVALGVIIRGGTPHFEYVSSATTDGLTRVALDAGKPVGFGVLTLDDEQQGIDRAGLPGLARGQGRRGGGCGGPHRPGAAAAARLSRLRLDHATEARLGGGGRTLAIA